ncbi:hypothetical protein OXX69_000591 [Metschnikowia pulcherrima]
MPSAVEVPAMVSVSTSANVQIHNDFSSTMTNHVSVSMELFVRLFPDSQNAISAESNDTLRFVLIRFIGVPDFFPRFNIYKISSIDYEAPTPHSMTLTNHSNLSRFGADLTFDRCVIQSIEESAIPALEKVFVKVPAAIYDILDNSSEENVREKFISEYISENGGVLAQDDIIGALNGKVSLCEPFYQGRVTAETKLVFLQSSLSDIFGDSGISKKHMVEAISSDIDIDLSAYLSQNVVFDSESSIGKPLSEYMLDVRPLPHRIFFQCAPFAKEDPELYVFMSTRDLSKLGFPVFNGDLVKMHFSDESVTVKVCTLLEPNKTFVQDTVYVSPLLLVNLNLSENAKVYLRPFGTPAKTLHDSIPAANSATIARVASPITMDKAYQRSFFAELKTAFHTHAKCFRKGDFFPVCIDAPLARALFHFRGDQKDDEEEDVVPTGIPDSVAWFKVIEISGEKSKSEDTNNLQFRIDPMRTSLTSSGVEFVSVPENRFSQWHEYLQMPPCFDFQGAFSADPTTFKYAQEFYQVIQAGFRSSGRLDMRANVLLHSMSRGLGKTALVRSAALDLGINLIELDAFDFVKPGAELKSVGLLSGKIEKQLSGQLESLNCTIHHILYIRHIEALCAQVDINEQNASSATSLSLKVVKAIQEILKKYQNIILVVSSNDVDTVSDALRQILTFEIQVPVPSEKERLAIINFFLDYESKSGNTENIPGMNEDRPEFIKRPDFDDYQVSLRPDVKRETLALQSAGLTPLDLKSIVRKTKQAAILRHIRSAEAQDTKVDKLLKIGNGGSLLVIPEDFEKAINDARNEFSDSIGAPRIPNVKWEDIGGLDLVKDEILDTIDLPLKHPELFSNGLKKRSGILFYGPPGTGKTLLAKAIATNFSLNFFSVKGPELLNMYIGESEANVRRVFQKARDAKPCVIFFDELDSVAPKRGNQGDSGGVMDRIVSQLLAELDGMSGGESNGDGVFVVGATNRPDLLDEALLRPGRFDKLLYLGISDTNEKQTKILEALTRKFKLHDEVDLAKIAEKCSFTFTGADFYALCSDSMLNAMTRTASEVDAKLKEFNTKRENDGLPAVSSRWWFDNAATPEDIDVLVTMADFQKAQSELAPSVSAEELAHYLRVKENFEGAKKKDSQVDEGLMEEMNGNGYDTASETMNGHGIVISEV